MGHDGDVVVGAEVTEVVAAAGQVEPLRWAGSAKQRRVETNRRIVVVVLPRRDDADHRDQIIGRAGPGRRPADRHVDQAGVGDAGVGRARRLIQRLSDGKRCALGAAIDERVRSDRAHADIHLAPACISPPTVCPELAVMPEADEVHIAPPTVVVCDERSRPSRPTPPPSPPGVYGPWVLSMPSPS